MTIGTVIAIMGISVILTSYGSFQKGLPMSNLQVPSVMMSSLEICQVIVELAKDPTSGVKEKEHKHILRDIRVQLGLDEDKNHSPNLDLINSGSYIIEEIDTYKGKETKQIWLNQEETEILITGYSTPIRRAVLKTLRAKIAELESKNKPDFSIPKTLGEALLLAGKLAIENDKLLETTQEQAKVIEVQTPKVEQWDRFLDSKGLLSMGDAAKALKVGRNKLFEILREEKIMQKVSNTPYQRFIDQGLFEVIICSGEGWSGSVTKVTAKGLDYISSIIRVSNG